MRHEGSKQGLYRQLKINQLGQAAYDALERRAHSIVKRGNAVAQCRTLLLTGVLPSGLVYMV
jgi:hypothetical protein